MRIAFSFLVLFVVCLWIILPVAVALDHLSWSIKGRFALITGLAGVGTGAVLDMLFPEDDTGD